MHSTQSPDGQLTSPTEPRPVSALVRSFERLLSLTREEREHLDALAGEPEEIEPRHKLIQEGKLCDQMYLVRSGWLIEYKLLRNGRRQILSFRLPGDLVGLECLAYGTAQHSTATLTRCSVSRISRTKFEQTQREFPRLVTAPLLMTLQDRAILHEWEVNLGQRVALARVAHLLMELRSRLHSRGLARDDKTPFPVTQEEIADCAGLTAPYVNRVLQKLRSKGLVQLDHHALTILDPVELSLVAGFKADYIEQWAEGTT